MINSFNKNRISCELLAPAGNFDMLHAAVDAGADAAYLGLQSFNARRNAKNFDFDSFAEACTYAHLRGVKLYVAMNTIVFEDELDEAIKVAAEAYRIGADAFIIQDLGLAYALQREIPGIRLHASTQMSIHSKSGVRMASELGFSRVTLAREMSLGEIESICKEADELGLEVETFAHGALCISYSWQCLMSSMIGCRSANRGLCAQPCRLEYELVDTRDPERKIKAPGDHLLSPKDLCSLDDVGELVDIGVSSLKIEGRMKSPEYAHAVVSVYRRQLDAVLSAAHSDDACPEPDPSAREKLKSVFSRGFSSAYLEGNRTNSMMSYQRPNNRGQFVGRVKAVDGDTVTVSLDMQLKAGDVCEVWTSRGNLLFDVPRDSSAQQKSFSFELDDVATRAKGGSKGVSRPNKGDRVFRVRSADAQVEVSAFEPRIPVDGKVIAQLDEPLRIEFSLAKSNDAVSVRLERRIGERDVSATASGPIVEPARTKSISEDEVIEHVGRMGQTPFELYDIEVSLDEGIGMGFSQIHKVRAAALQNLETKVMGALGYKPREKFEIKPFNTSSKGLADTSAPRLSPSDISICAYISNPECARAAKRNGADFIYVNALNYRRGMSQMAGMLEEGNSQAGYPKHCIQVVGAISHDRVGLSREACLGIDAWGSIQEESVVSVGSLDALGKAEQLSCDVEISPELPIVNSASFDVSKAIGVRKVWLSSELSLPQIELLAKTNDGNGVKLGVVISGTQELMTCEHCILMSMGECDQTCPTCSRRKVPFALRDRMGYEFPVVTDHLGRSHIFNSLNTDNMNALPALIEAGVTSFMIDARLMDVERTAQQTARLRDAIEQALSGGQVEKRKGTTTGHFYRPVA